MLSCWLAGQILVHGSVPVCASPDNVDRALVDAEMWKEKKKLFSGTTTLEVVWCCRLRHATFVDPTEQNQGYDLVLERRFAARAWSKDEKYVCRKTTRKYRGRKSPTPNINDAGTNPTERLKV